MLDKEGSIKVYDACTTLCEQIMITMKHTNGIQDADMTAFFKLFESTFDKMSSVTIATSIMFMASEISREMKKVLVEGDEYGKSDVYTGNSSELN